MSFSQILAFLVARAPDLRAELRGAHPDDLAELAEACPRPLPAAYLEFLRAMGGSSGSFQPLPVADCRAASLWPHIVATSPSYPADRFFKVGLDLGIGRDILQDWFLDLQRGDPDDPPVVRFEDEGDPADFFEARVHVVARSWTAMLQARAFLTFAVEARAHQRRAAFAAGTTGLDEVAAICGRLGLTPTLPSRPGLHTLERADLSALLELPPESARIHVRVGADSAASAQLLVEVIGDNIEASTGR